MPPKKFKTAQEEFEAKKAKERYELTDPHV